MPQRRTKPTELLARRHRVAQLYLQGRTLVEIGSALGVHYATVSRDLEWLRREWLASAVRDFDAARGQELAKIDELERQAWQGWFRSLEARETKTIERDQLAARQAGEMPQVERGKARVRTEGQAGNPAYLHQIGWCITKRCELLGIRKPQEPPP